MIEKIVLNNAVKLKLLVSMRIYPVMNVSRIVRYKELVKKQRVEELKLVKVDRIEEWEVEKILNKRKLRKVIRYLVCQREFITENDIQKK